MQVKSGGQATSDESAPLSRNAEAIRARVREEATGKTTLEPAEGEKKERGYKYLSSFCTYLQHPKMCRGRLVLLRPRHLSMPNISAHVACARERVFSTQRQWMNETKMRGNVCLPKPVLYTPTTHPMIRTSASMSAIFSMTDMVVFVSPYLMPARVTPSAKLNVVLNSIQLQRKEYIPFNAVVCCF